MRTLSVLGVCVCAAASVAQSEILVEIADPVLLPGESTTVTLSAVWPGSGYAFASMTADLRATAGLGAWSELEVIPVMDGPGARAGMVVDSSVLDIHAIQLNIGPTGFEPDRSNPIPLWRATFTAPDVVSDPFNFEFETVTTEFSVYVRPDSLDTRSHLGELTEGAGTIRVVPAPASLALLGIGGLAVCRRRR